MLLSSLIIFLASVDVVAFSNYSAYDLEKCNSLTANSNSYGGFVYGFSRKTLYSSMLLPNHNNRYVNVPYNIISSCQSGELSCAMYICNNRTFRYGITTMNMNSGEILDYTFDGVNDALNKMFSLSGSYAYFVRLDKAYSYVAVYGLDGKLKKKCSFSTSIYLLFNNNSITYAMLYDGRIYRFSGTSYTQVAKLDKCVNIFDAGAGYICTESGEIVSLENGETLETVSYSKNCVVADSGGTYSVSNNRLMFSQKNVSDRFIELSSPIRCIVAHNGRVATLNFDCDYNDISKSELKSNYDQYISSIQGNNSNSRNGNQNSNTQIPNEYRVEQGKYIVGVAPSTSVKEFKKKFSDDVTIYNNDGNIVSSGNIRTGYTVSIYDDSYIIIIIGDVTGEGNVKSNDINMLMSYLVGSVNFNDLQMLSADYDCNGVVDNRDLVIMARYSSSAP
ncbi:MAG: dockerin type I repeat-containing protein [Ruminococcus sp.]|nr:dockerin type I repeat-containing protein [Ruminococcus sp.]